MRQIEAERMEIELVSGSMPARQATWEPYYQSRSYFIAAEGGGDKIAPECKDGYSLAEDDTVEPKRCAKDLDTIDRAEGAACPSRDEADSSDETKCVRRTYVPSVQTNLATLGGGIRRFRTPVLENGRWHNIVPKSAASVYIPPSDSSSIGKRPKRFEALLSLGSPESRIKAAQAGIASARDYIRTAPSTCSARKWVRVDTGCTRPGGARRGRPRPQRGSARVRNSTCPPQRFSSCPTSRAGRRRSTAPRSSAWTAGPIAQPSCYPDGKRNLVAVSPAADEPAAPVVLAGNAHDKRDPGVEPEGTMTANILAGRSISCIPVIVAVTVKLSDAAKAEFDALPLGIKGRINAIFARLALWPAVSGAKPMRHDLQGSYRVRTGAYRVIFEVVGATLTVIRVGIRRDVYED